LRPNYGLGLLNDSETSAVNERLIKFVIAQQLPSQRGCKRGISRVAAAKQAGGAIGVKHGMVGAGATVSQTQLRRCPLFRVKPRLTQKFRE
jgi:hypothetical protein